MTSTNKTAMSTHRAIQVFVVLDTKEIAADGRHWRSIWGPRTLPTGFAPVEITADGCAVRFRDAGGNTWRGNYGGLVRERNVLRIGAGADRQAWIGL